MPHRNSNLAVVKAASTMPSAIKEAIPQARSGVVRGLRLAMGTRALEGGAVATRGSEEGIEEAAFRAIIAPLMTPMARVAIRAEWAPVDHR